MAFLLFTPKLSIWRKESFIENPIARFMLLFAWTVFVCMVMSAFI